MQTLDFFLYLGYFRPAGENNLQKKESTMLPHILSLSKGRLQSRLRKSCKANITFELLRNAW
jgi:hypothetical protein